MAKIPFYNQNVGQQAAQFGRVREQDVSSGLQSLAQGLQDVGTGLQAQTIQLAQKQHRADLEADKLEIAKRNSQADLDLQSAWQDMQGSYKEGDGDLPQKFFSYYENYTKDSLQGLKTEQGKDMLSNQLLGMRSQWGQRAIQWQAQETARSQIAGLDGVRENYKRSVIQNPAKAEEYAAQYKASVDSLSLPPEYKRDAATKAMEEIAFTAEQAIADKNPGASFKQGSRWSFDALPAERQLKLMDYAKQRQKQLQAEARQSIAMSLGDVQAQLMDGQTPQSMPSEGQIRGAFGDKAEPIIRRLNQARQFGRDIQSFAMMSDTEIQQTIANRQPTQTAGYADASRMQDQRIQAARQVVQQRQKDPAAYLLKHSPDVAQAYNQMATYMSDPSADESQRQQAAQIYATKSLALQNQLGVAKPKIVPETYAQQIVSSFYQQDNGGENAATQIEQQQQVWGPLFPKVMEQIGKDLPKEAQVIASGVPKDLAERLAATGKLKDEQLYTPLQKGQKAEIQSAVANELAPFAASLQGQAGGNATYSTYYESAVRTAASYVLGGMDPGKAAEKVAKGIINDKYEFTDTYRIPKSLDTGAIKLGADAVMRSLSPDDLITLPGIAGVPDEENRRQLMDAISAGGQWVPNNDESGLSLTLNGYRVLDKDGRPIMKTWEDLTEAGTSRAEAVRRLPGTVSSDGMLILPGAGE